MKRERRATKGTMGLREALREAFKERASKTESLDKSLSFLNRYYFNGEEVEDISGEEINEWFIDSVEQMNAQRRLDGKRAYRKDTSIALGFVGYPDAEFTKTLTESEKRNLSKDVRDAFSLWLGHTVEAQADHEDEGFVKDKKTGETKRVGGWHSHLFGLPLDANGNLEPRKLTNSVRMKQLHRTVVDYLNQKIPGLDGQYASRNWDFVPHIEGGDPDKTPGLSANERAKVLEYIDDAKALKDDAQRILGDAKLKSDELTTRDTAVTKRERAVTKRERKLKQDFQTKIDALNERSAALDKRQTDIDALDIRLTNSLKKSEQKEKECDNFYGEVKSQIGVDIRSENWQQSLTNIIQTLRRKALEESEEVVGSLLGALRNFHEYATFILGFKDSYTRDELDIFKRAQTVTQQMSEIEISYGPVSPDDDSKTQQTNAHTTQSDNAKRLQSYLDAIDENRNENQGEYDSPLL